MRKLAPFCCALLLYPALSHADGSLTYSRSGIDGIESGATGYSEIDNSSMPGLVTHNATDLPSNGTPTLNNNPSPGGHSPVSGDAPHQHTFAAATDTANGVSPSTGRQLTKFPMTTGVQMGTPSLAQLSTSSVSSMPGQVPFVRRGETKPSARITCRADSPVTCAARPH